MFPTIKTKVQQEMNPPLNAKSDTGSKINKIFLNKIKADYSYGTDCLHGGPASCVHNNTAVSNALSVRLAAAKC